MTKQENITPENTTFVILCFEGPDRYSMVGGLGTRVINLSETLTSLGFLVHYFFIGDPRGKGEEVGYDGKLVWHRWCQWLSEYYPGGVYDGEFEKIGDFNKSAPAYVVKNIIEPALVQGKLVVVLGEEWHTAETMCRISDLLAGNGLRDRVVMFWNANNTFGFDRINWKRLDSSTTITTVSRYMKQIMKGMGLNPLVIPNGIPRSFLRRVDPAAADRLREAVNTDLILTKVARWDPDKRWGTALEAAARLKAQGVDRVLLARGGMEPYAGDILYGARSLGLTVKETREDAETLEAYFQAIAAVGKTDVINIKFHCPPDFLRVLYHASHAVLANSQHEPFGLVGLETMAAGGVAFTGGTGEDYAIPFYNAIVLETTDPEEIEAEVLYLVRHPEEAELIRRRARYTARQFVWEHIIQKNLTRKLEQQAIVQGLLSA